MLLEHERGVGIESRVYYIASYGGMFSRQRWVARLLEGVLHGSRGVENTDVAFYVANPILLVKQASYMAKGIAGV